MALLDYLGVVVVILIIVGVGVYSGRQVKSASDFAGSGRSGSWVVCGGIMGALVSSQASIGTAQLAFQFGLSAWWFTLGSGIGCLILALVYAKPLRATNCTTLMSVIDIEYGTNAKRAGSILSSIGIFISVLAQVVASTGLISVIFPVSVPTAALLSVVLMALYVVFGGALGAGMAGVAKMVLLYITCLVGLLAVLWMTGGIGGLINNLLSALDGTALGNINHLQTTDDILGNYGNLTARGAMKDIGSGISLLLGVLSTQTYAQAIWSGKSDKSAQRGALLAAFLIPPIGIAGIVIGIYMRGHYVTQAEVDALITAGQSIPEGMGVINSSIQAFPAFIINHIPRLVSGMFLGALLITVVGGGAGLAHGVASIVVNDILKMITKKFNDAKRALMVMRGAILLTLAVSAIIACTVPSAIINDFGFLSMGLRGAVVIVPLTCALFLPGKIDRRFAFFSIIGGPVGVLAGKLGGSTIDPLFIGMFCACFITVLGFCFCRFKGVQDNTAK